MNNKEKIDKWLSDNDGEDYCKYCKYDDECSHGIVCYGGSPIEPPCCSHNTDELLNIDAILADMEEENFE